MVSAYKDKTPALEALHMFFFVFLFLGGGGGGAEHQFVTLTQLSNNEIFVKNKPLT